jgi:feruloyl esterase
LPRRCVIHRRKGIDGEEFGIEFALALPARPAWNGDFMMQGGGGGNGIVNYPLGAAYTGDKPALVRGFAVASTDSGHKARAGPFDFSFMRDQQAYLDFAYLANAEVAQVAKQVIAHYYAKPATYSYFVGCSTGGREGMILSRRYPTAFNGIVAGDPAMRTGLSNLAIGKWIPVAYNQAAPKDESGKPDIEKVLTDDDRKLFMDALMKRCDARDGVVDGMIFDPLGCKFDPAELACKAGHTEQCIPPKKIAAIKKAFAGPKNAYGTQVYPGFLYDTGIAMNGPVLQDASAPILPVLTDVRKVAAEMAFAIGLAAQQEGIAPKTTPDVLHARVEQSQWVPEYSPISDAEQEKEEVLQ